MRNRGYLIAAVLVLSATSSAGPASLPATAREVRIPMPLIGSILGRPPSEVKPKPVSSPDGTKRFVEKTGEKPSPGSLVVTELIGTVAVELSVSDGVVSRAVAYINQPTSANEPALAKRLAVDDPRVTVKQEPFKSPAGRGLVKVTFVLVPEEAYILANGTPAQIADGIRNHRWVDGMSESDQRAANDGPGLYSVMIVWPGVNENGYAQATNNPIGKSIGSGGGGPGDPYNVEVIASGRIDAISKAQAGLPRGQRAASARFSKSAPR